MTEQNKKWIIRIIMIVISTNVMTFLFVNIGFGAYIRMHKEEIHGSAFEEQLDKLVKLEKNIQNEYYKEVDSSVLIDGAMRGMFEAIGDPYSKYYSKEEYEALLESIQGTYEGVGIVVVQDELDNAVVLTPYKGTPAGDAGIAPGDIIIKVDGEDVVGKGIDYTVSKIKGEANTPVQLVVLRNETELTFDLQRSKIEIQTVDSKLMDDGVGYIEITSFEENTAQDFSDQLQGLIDQGMTSLIIDLRYNGGGLVDSVVAIADDLLGKSEIVYTIDRQGGKVTYTSDEDQITDVPLVVLVNGGSASASEILGGAVQDLERGVLIGEQTYGKGIVQSIKGMMDGSGYQLTISEYFTPLGKNIHEIGLTPDIIIPPLEQYINVLNVPEAEDVQLQEAIKYLKENK